MLCGRCGHRNEEAARFCSSCGSELASAEEPTAAHPVDARDDLAPDPQTATLAPGTALLVVERGPNAGSTYLINSDSVTVGRHPESAVFLDDITVSRRHCVIERSGTGFAIRDAGSLNGTYVNLSRVEDVILNDGDAVVVGRFHLLFRVGA